MYLRSFSAGVYGEVGYRVGGTGFGAGATTSQSLDYNFKHKTTTTTTSAGVYASFGPFNADGNVSSTYDITNKQHLGYSWGVSAGIGYGNPKGGVGLFVGYGSGGFNYGLGGYYDPTVAFSNNNKAVLIANDDGTYSEKNASSDYLSGSSSGDGNHSTNLRNNPNITEVRNPDGTFSYTVTTPNRHRVNDVQMQQGIINGSFNSTNGQVTFSTVNRANTATFLSTTSFPGNRFNMRNFNYKYSNEQGRQNNHLNLFGRTWYR